MLHPRELTHPPSPGPCKAGQPGPRGTRHTHPGASETCTGSGSMARPSREGPPQQRWGWERERTDQNSEPEACSWTRAEAAGGSRKSERAEKVSKSPESTNSSGFGNLRRRLGRPHQGATHPRVDFSSPLLRNLSPVA